MANLHQFLKAMFDQGASDLHLTTGSPPQLRIDGKLIPLKTAPLTPVETKQLCYSVMTDAQKRKFEEENELDLSFGVKGLCRFRANFFVQRGADLPFLLGQQKIDDPFGMLLREQIADAVDG